MLVWILVYDSSAERVIDYNLSAKKWNWLFWSKITQFYNIESRQPKHLKTF